MGFCAGCLALLHAEGCVCAFLCLQPNTVAAKILPCLEMRHSSTEHLHLVVSPSTGQIGCHCSPTCSNVFDMRSPATRHPADPSLHLPRGCQGRRRLPPDRRLRHPALRHQRGKGPLPASTAPAQAPQGRGGACALRGRRQAAHGRPQQLLLHAL